MQDLKLRELVDEVSRLTTIYNQCDPEISDVIELELEAANKRLDKYVKERKESYGKTSYS